jgi:hypothetical protein
MGYWKTKVINGTPKFSDKPGCHYRISPDGIEAIIELTGTRTDYDEINGDIDTQELTRHQAEELARSWNQ